MIPTPIKQHEQNTEKNPIETEHQIKLGGKETSQNILQA